MGTIDCLDRTKTRSGEDAVSPGGPLPSPLQVSLPRRSDNALVQATAVLNNALDGYELPLDSVSGTSF